MVPKFIIVGAMKSGTSTLAHHVGEHPEVYMPSGEVHFFYDQGRGNFEKGVEWYKKKFEGATSGQIVGEKTPTYSYLPGVAERIYDLIPDAKLIWIFRNPIDRAYSNYWHTVRAGLEPLGFEKAVRSEQERDIWKGYLRRSLYAEQVDRYLEYFDKEQMHFCLFEELKEDPESVLENVYRFISVDSKHASQLNPHARKNVTRIPRSKLFRCLTRSVLNEVPLLSSITFRLDHKFNQRSEPGYPEMDQTLKRELINYFKPYNQKLASQTGLDTKIWEREK